MPVLFQSEKRAQSLGANGTLDRSSWDFKITDMQCSTLSRFPLTNLLTMDTLLMNPQMQPKIALPKVDRCNAF
jgi:hypothetical protein